MNLAEAIKRYLEYLEIERGRSRKTLENYSRYMQKFGLFAEEYFGKKLVDINPGAIDLEAVRNFRIYLNRLSASSGGGLKKITQSYYIITLRGFLKYLAKIDESSLAAEKVELGKVPTREIDLISYEDLERLLKVPQGDSLIALRDKAILEILFSTGLRVSELCSLNRDRINLDKGEFSVLGKGSKIRVVFISDKANTALSQYLKKREDIEEALFVSYSKANNPKVLGRINPRLVQRLIQNCATRAGIVRPVTPHTLRHLFATDLLQNGADLRSVQMMLGHSNLNTTQVYTHLTNKELGEIHKAFHGRRRA